MDSYSNFGIYNDTGTLTATNSLNSLVPNLVNDGTSSSALQSGSMNLQGSLVNGYLQSSNFVAGTIGWQIKANGDVEFNNGIFRGSIRIGTGQNVFIADTNGIYLGSTTFATAPFSVDMNGNMIVTSLQRRDYHWFTVFESIDGYAKSADGTGAVVCNPGSVDLTLGNANNNVTSLQKVSTIYRGFTWDKARRIKFSFLFQNCFNNAQEIRAGLGSHIANRTDSKIGFLLENYTLYAISADSTSYTAVAYGEISNNFVYDLEVVFTPGVQATYSLNGVLFATITTNLPSGTNYSENIIEVYMKNGQNVASKGISIGYYDFWQKL